MVIPVHKKLVEEIDKFIAETSMGESYFGKRAVGNSEVLSRLKKGRSITGVTEQRLKDFMSLHRAEAAE